MGSFISSKASVCGAAAECKGGILRLHFRLCALADSTPAERCPATLDRLRAKFVDDPTGRPIVPCKLGLRRSVSMPSLMWAVLWVRSLESEGEVAVFRV